MIVSMPKASCVRLVRFCPLLAASPRLCLSAGHSANCAPDAHDKVVDTGEQSTAIGGTGGTPDH